MQLYINLNVSIHGYFEIRVGAKHWHGVETAFLKRTQENRPLLAKSTFTKLIKAIQHF